MGDGWYIGTGFLMSLVLIIPVWRIYRRAGFNPAWSLLLFIPGLGFLICLLFLALRPWPGQIGAGTGSAFR